MTLPRAALAEVHGLFETAGKGPLGLALSGGGDSSALAALAVDWARTSGVRLAAATVDHGLREGSGAEAQSVGAWCREMGIPHEILTWTGWDGQGNLQDRAREARAGLIAEWALARGIATVATGHTLDDQAETVLMRLARGSGVDGLSGIAPRRTRLGVTWLRPLLGLRRAALRDYLSSEGLPWIEDPSNEDPRFDRVRTRRALEVLGEIGITAEGLAATAARMARARAALEEMTAALADGVVTQDRGDVLIDWPGLAWAPEEMQLRLVSAALMWVASAPYRPRATALAELMAALEAGTTMTLAGCHVSGEGPRRRICREYAAVRETTAPLGSPWDGRWRLEGPRVAGAEIRALGEEGLRTCPGWREAGMPRVSLIASPAVWAEGRLIAAPLAGFGRGWRAEPSNLRQGVRDALLSH